MNVAEERTFPRGWGYESFQFSTRLSPCIRNSLACYRELLEHLQFDVTEVWGTSAVVAPRERYVVWGTYRLTGQEPYGISLAVLGRAFGATAHVLPGEGRFETSTEILEQTGRLDQVGIVISRGGKHTLTTWITLSPGQPKP